tara:strand:+ start:194 stop:913 length:720 start_codon:yes stop_codon:yes gene_type:complete
MKYLKDGARKLGVKLNSAQLKQFQIYYLELVSWNQRVNLTTITDFKEVQIKHFLDSLSVTIALNHQINDTKIRLVDIGTGAGLPGLPIKIAFPALKLILIEATAKKAAFLDHLKAKLGLNDVEIVVGRAEEIAHEIRYRKQFNIVLSRAVAPLPTLVELALPFCTMNGSFIAQKKGAIDQEIRQADKAINLLGGNLREIKRVNLNEFLDERYLIIIDKTSPTPEQYPRRSGIPAKRPLI